MLRLLLVLLVGPPPGPPPLVQMLSRAQELLEASDRGAARRELTEALQLYPGSAAVYNFLGVLEAEEGNYKEAEKRLLEAVHRSPEYTDALLNLGRLYQENQLKDTEAVAKALGVYGKILTYQADHAEARYQSAVVLHAMGAFARSLEELRRLPPADQDRPSALALRCADHAARGDREEADHAAARLLDRPDFTALDVRFVLPTLAAHDREDLAQKLLEALRMRGLTSPGDLRRLGLLYERQGQLDRARKVLEQAAQASSNDVALLLDLARIAHKDRDYRGALGYLAHARDLDPANAQVHFFFGMVCVALDLGAEAYNSLKEAVRLEPDNAPFNYALGATALNRHDPAEAIPYFRKYVALKPDDFHGPFAVGVAAFKAHDFATARVELAPLAGHRETAAGANYFLARMAREENDLEQALQLCQRAIEADPRYADAHAELGLLYLRKREPERAEEALRRCLEIDPDSYLGNLHLLMLYERTKDARQAAQARRFEEIKQHRDRKAEEFLRLIEVRPY
jgi:tetratricopeptide (TPR) repeat protein